MRLILTAEVPNLGEPGEIVEVRDGYGRNYLVPQGKAIVATKGAEKQIATIRRSQSAREIRGAEHAREVRAAPSSPRGISAPPANTPCRWRCTPM